MREGLCLFNHIGFYKNYSSEPIAFSRMPLPPSHQMLISQQASCVIQFCNSCEFTKPFFVICQGTSWLHVGTDQPFISVSIGAFHQVWAVARDGSTFYRGSVAPKTPAGERYVTEQVFSQQGCSQSNKLRYFNVITAKSVRLKQTKQPSSHFY